MLVGLGALVAFTGYVAYLAWPTMALGWVLAIVRRGMAALDRVAEILDTRPRIADRPAAVALKNVRGHIRFENVSFSYLEGDELESQNPYLRQLMGEPHPGPNGKSVRQDHGSNGSSEVSGEDEYSARIVPTARPLTS